MTVHATTIDAGPAVTEFNANDCAANSCSCGYAYSATRAELAVPQVNSCCSSCVSACATSLAETRVPTAGPGTETSVWDRAHQVFENK